MNRRSFFLVLQSLLAANTMAEGKSTPGGKRKRVLVIGAGLSGLAAARHLQSLDQDVTVLEARDRMGGRIHTSTRWKDMPLDLGATWIHGVKGNPIRKLGEDIQARLLETRYDASIAYRADGKEFTGEDEKQRAGISRRIEDLLRAARKADTDVSIATAVGELIGRDAPADKARMARFLLNGNYEHEYAGSIHEMSAHWFDDVRGFAGGDKFFADGFAVIIGHLAASLKIEFGQTVKAIDWTASEVRVTTTARVFAADQVLVTLPLGVLKAGAVTFSPALPAEKNDAIARLGMGVLNKCYLRFPRAFWPSNVDWLEHVSERHGEWTQWVSFLKSANQPVLLGFNAADFGRAMEKLTDEQIVADAMKRLRAIHGKNIPEPESHQITRWASDPFAGGSYSFNALGSRPGMRSALAKPLNGRLFFAGEATARNDFATAHGAYLSGLRAGEEMAMGT
jgi:monoamine oxidase